MQRSLKLLASLILVACFTLGGNLTAQARTASPYDSSDFVMLTDVIPDILQEIRYYSAYNFVGSRIDGYEAPVALMTKEAAAALKNAAAEFRKDGYVIKVYDTYRPQRAVNHFMRWIDNTNDIKMKAYFYPFEPKNTMVAKEYIARKSGHSKGSTIDMTIVNMKSGQELDVGEHFDYFGDRSHSNYTGILPQQVANRQYLIAVMERNGFANLASEWWHFTLKSQPFPDTYFDFPVTLLNKK